jgi:putative peptidoglycan lipid II flippase
VASGLRRFDEAVWMTRVMFPYIALISMVSLAAGILNTWRRFAVPAATPVLLNLAVIAAALWGAPWFASLGIEPIYAVACGTVLGGVLQLVIQLPALRSIGYLPRLSLSVRRIGAAWHHPGVRRVLSQMGPAVLGVSVAQISLLINTHIASRLAVGSVSWLNLADRLMELPTALLGVAMGVVLLPQLSGAQARGDEAGYSAMLDWGLRLVLLLALPCAVALVVFGQPMLAVLFHHGRFTANDVAQSAGPLMGYGAGLLGIVAIKVLAPGYYARQDVRTPVRIAIVVLVLTQALNLVLVPWLAHSALTLSISIGALINALWLLRGLVKLRVYQPAPGWGLFALRVVLACVALGAALAWAAHAIDWIAAQARPWWRAGLLAAVLAGVVVLYFGVLAACGLRLRQFMRRA